ncbi:class I SAM-dependent methyltransferase [Duganella sp. HH101]|uniref:class I SAM-dependent methyltransferase n=1 Tax=Duganella sp. HH101 TaxID=1781066 RepID=UPI0008749DF6|nr:class I SAM-dependent methyltransferase [Duganella sp. HH101]OFA04635.1 leucine carboxyl methyltransferase [Duganella sp. HH101]
MPQQTAPIPASHLTGPKPSAWMTATLRAALVVRARLAEDSWQAAHRQGVNQYVILGAGPDTYAYRADCLPSAQICEVDLQQAGLDDGAPSCFSWLGVTMYLRPDAVMRTLQDIASYPPGTSIVFDYCLQADQLTEPERMGLQVVTTALAAQGEHLLSAFEPQRLEHMLRHYGFSQVEHFGAQELTERYLADRTDGLRLSGIFRMIRATV